MTPVTVTSSPVKSADRVLDIFELLASEPDGLTVSEISSRLGIARSSTHGLVQTVARRGYLRRDHRDGRRVALGASVVQLGLSVTDRLELRTIARGPLERLVAATHDTVLLAIPDHGNLIYLDKIFSDQRGFRTDPRASARSPLHASSLGKALLAAAGDLDQGQLPLDVRPLDREVAQRMAKELPRGSFVEIPRAVHTLHEDNPDAVLAALKPFLGF